jgi:K+-sensing histidine kinase KdpD
LLKQAQQLRDILPCVLSCVSITPHSLAPAAVFIVPLQSDLLSGMQVLLNLVCTCLKFTHAGDVRVSASQTHSAASVVVADTGQGIPAEQLAHALDPFQQVMQLRRGQRDNSSAVKRICGFSAIRGRWTL